MLKAETGGREGPSEELPLGCEEDARFLVVLGILVIIGILFRLHTLKLPIATESFKRKVVQGKSRRFPA